MPRKLYHVHLNEEERKQLETFVKQGKKSARAITRARILLFADEQKTDEDIATLLHVSRPTVYHLRKKYHERTSQDILELLQERPRSGQPIKIDTRVESHISLIACSDPPEGSARWTRTSKSALSRWPVFGFKTSKPSSGYLVASYVQCPGVHRGTPTEAHSIFHNHLIS